MIMVMWLYNITLWLWYDDDTSIIFILNEKREYPVIILKNVKQWFKVFQQTLK